MAFFRSIPKATMGQASVENKQVAHQSAMMVLARAGDYAQARQIFIEMTSQGIPALNTHFSALLIACAPGCHSDVARGIFDLMPQYNVKPDVANWTTLLSYHRENLSECLRI